MEIAQRKPLRITNFGSTLFTKILPIFICFYVTLNSDLYSVSALSQENNAPPLKPVVYVDLLRWENRSTHPRFLLFREHFRRQLGSNSNEENFSSFDQQSDKNVHDGKPIHVIISKPVSSENDKVGEDSIPAQTSSESAGSTNNDDEHEVYNDDDDISSLEKLLSERNGIIPKATLSSNAKSSNADEEKTHPAKKPITFPKDRTNPCNRLQINPEEEKEAESPTQVVKEVERDVDSLEIGNRENFFSGSSSSEEGGAEDETKDLEELKLIKDAVPTFDLTMNIIKLSNWKDKNVLFSPLSIASVLSMLMLGSEGETFNELATLLDRDNSSMPTSTDITRYHNAFSKLTNYLRALSGEPVILSMANELFLDKNYPLEESFRRELLRYYEAPIETYDFSSDGELFKNKVNQWVKEKTQGQIEKILEEAPSPLTVMGIINAIYFKGSWELPFSDKLTRWKDFRVNSKETTQVQMMVNLINVPYVKRDLFEMVALPYKQNRTGLYIILPRGNETIDNLHNVEKFITKEELRESILAMNSTKVAISLPKLKFSSDGEMVEILEKMNLTTVFSHGNANFSGISSKNLYMSSLLHRAAVEINEKGTEASAVSLGTGDRIIDELPVPFRCDKPFLFFIYHVKADTILFWGRVIKPSYT